MKNTNMYINRENGIVTTTYTYPGDIDGLYSETTTSTRVKYDRLDEEMFLNHPFLKAYAKGYVSLYDLENSKHICHVPENTKFSFYLVLGHVYIKAAYDNTQIIYNNNGNLLARYETHDLSVEFTGCGASIVGKNKKTGQTDLMFPLD